MFARLVGTFTKGFWSILVAAIVTASNALAATPNKKVTIMFADFSERAGIVFAAKDQHFFEEQGLDSEVVQVRSGPVAIRPRRQQGAVLYGFGNASSLGAMAGGLDLAFVAGLVNRLDGYFVTN